MKISSSHPGLCWRPKTLQFWGNVCPESSEVSKEERLSFTGLFLGENGQGLKFKDEDIDSDEMQRVHVV